MDAFMKRMARNICLGIAIIFLSTGLIKGEAFAADEWPERQLTFVVTLGVGGSADRTARAISSFLPDYIGQSVKVVNQKGAGGHVGTTYFLAQPDDGYTVLATSIAPYIGNAILQHKPGYSLDDFAFINGQWIDSDIVAVNSERPWKTLPALLEAIKNNPGEISVSVVPGSTGEITTYILLDAAGIPRDNLKVVTYQSGGAARTAVAGGQVDFTVLAADGTLSIADFVTGVAIINKQKVAGWDAPPVNEALAPMGIKVPLLTGSVRGLAVHASFKEKYPQRYAKLVEAYRKMLESKDFQSFAKRSAIGAEWLGPDATTEMIYTTFELLKKYSAN